MRVVTWNIQWGRGVDGHVDLARTAAVARSCNADMLCFQEVAVNHPGLPGGAGEDQAARLSQLLPGYAAIFGVASDLPDGEGGRRLFGNLILSRLPLLQAIRHALPWPVDRLVPSMPRLALETIVVAPWGPLLVVTTHLEYYSARQRFAQVEALRQIHAEACAHAGPLRPDRDVDPPFAALPRPSSALLCGDFNFAVDTLEYARIHEAIPGAPPLADVWQTAHPGERHVDTVGVNGAEWPDHPYCCDFMFATPDLLARLVDAQVLCDTAASDHQPVQADFRP